MNLIEFCEQTPVERHSQIVVSGGRLFFDGEEYVIRGMEELRLVRSNKELEQSLAEIAAKLSIK